jgi:ribosomal protein L12E/L44/L45/RPP1/RPP2
VLTERGEVTKAIRLILQTGILEQFRLFAGDAHAKSTRNAGEEHDEEQEEEDEQEEEEEEENSEEEESSLSP